MPKGKNRHSHVSDYKQPSSSYVHPSLQTKASAASASPGDTASVNERIHFLRRVQRPPPNMELELGISHLNVSTSPLPRARMAPGPPPPRSWLGGATSAGQSQRLTSSRKPSRLDYFPGLPSLPMSSLQHQALKAMARDIDWHLEYDHIYLSILPVPFKVMLLSYIAYYGPIACIDTESLKLLFARPETSSLSDATGCDELDRLDLGRSVGYTESLKQVEKFWMVQRRRRRVSGALPESWDEIPITISSSLRFPQLTKLSLAQPGPKASWTDLLSLARHLGALTHLSLAGWPMPHFATTSQSNAVESVHTETLEDEAIHILGLLARETASLSYLSLADCHDWYKTLRHTATHRPHRPRRRHAYIDFDDAETISQESHTKDEIRSRSLWTSAWPRLLTLDLSQSTPVPKLDHNGLKMLFDRRKFRRDMIPAIISNPSHNRARQGGETSESYTIIGPIDVVENIAERQNRQQWLQLESDALGLGGFVNATRVSAGLRLLQIDYGWGEELIGKPQW